MRFSGMPGNIEDEMRHLRLHDEMPLRLLHAVLPNMVSRRSGTLAA